MSRWKRIIVLFAAALASQFAYADDKPNPFESDVVSGRVVFIGDSITYDGRYTHYIESWYITHLPGKKIDFINVGLPSETVSGLSEPAHPWPRPNVHERLARILQSLKPDVVVACYGMNDGIYYPLSRERFQSYKQGIEQLISKVAATGAHLYILTPPPFDPKPIADKLRGDDAKEYSWVNPYVRYDDTLAAYSEWLLKKNDRRIVRVIDTRTPTLEHLATRRASDPNFALSTDGVHCDAFGQWLIAKAFLNEVAPTMITKATNSLAQDDGTSSATSTPLMPIDPAWSEQSLAIDRPWQFSSLVYTYRDGRAKSYQLIEGDTVLGTFTREQMKRGIDISTLSMLSIHQRNAELLKVLGERQYLIGRSWMTHIGHKRPDTTKGQPLEQAIPMAKELHGRAGELAHPVNYEIRVVPVK